MKLLDLKQINKRSIHSAGPRYTPGQDPAAPNLEIESLNAAVEGLICGKLFRDRIANVIGALERTWNDAHRIVSHAYPRQLPKPLQLLNLFSKFACCPPERGLSLVTKSKTSASRAEERLAKLMEIHYEEEQQRLNELREEEREGKHSRSHELDSKLRGIRDRRHYLRQYESALDDAIKFLNSPGCNLQYNNRAILLGAWGTGKTHYLCDLAINKIGAGSPALLVLAKDFDPGADTGRSLADYTSLSDSFEDFVSQLNELGKGRGERALLLIDGVNESDHEAWRRDIRTLTRIVKRYHYVGLIISCRQPFESLIFSDKDRNEFVHLVHHGFTDIEFDAQTEFFKFYDIPLPEVPLLAEEFSRPLALKIMCGAFKELPKKTQQKGFAGIASGQRGMTFILERFINRRADCIEKDLGLRKGFCWSLIKGDDGIANLLIAGIAPNMAERFAEYIKKEECLRIIRARPEIKQLRKAKKLYHRLIAEGILSEDMMWRPEAAGGPITVIRLPYQRFNDHIIARHLLARHLGTTSEKTIRRSFYANAPLGKLFCFQHPNFPKYKMEGWAEALIIEFPERVKRVLPKEKRELFFYLPMSRQNLAAYHDAFVDSMFWRSGNSISQQTDRIVGAFFWQRNEYLRSRIIEAMIAVATKPGHPYNAARLYLNLEKPRMPDRDLHWSEHLRKRSGDSTVERLIRWFESRVPRLLTEDSALNQIIILSLILTTTDRGLRGRATRILVLLGERFPSALFKHTERTLSFNDPYVPERMLAACYGVAMSLWADKKAESFHRALPGFARTLAKKIFISGGEFLTQHTLMREYALGVINLAREGQSGCIASKYIKYLKPPFPSVPDPFPDQTKISHEACEDGDYAIHMDFGNYTIGHLVPDRNNYEMEHPGYKEIRRKIEWRIGNLGYVKRKFEHIDQLISRESFWIEQGDYGKIDRYGKKYSWIAYFEMYGILKARGLLPDYRQAERTSDCDIDPSFPIRPPEWRPPFLELFPKKYSGEVDWLRDGPEPNYEHLIQLDEINGVKGPWVMLDGHIVELEPDTRREVFTFLRGLILDETDIPAIETRLAGVDHPGSGLPNRREDYYTFAGEVPWSAQFAGGIRTKSGKLRRYTEEAFPISVSIQKRRRIKKVWKQLYETLGEIPKLGLMATIASDNDDFRLENRLDELQAAVEAANARFPESEHLTIKELFWEVPTEEEIESGYKNITVVSKIPGIKIETTSWRHSWESYHSKVNDFSGFLFPSPQICEKLGLITCHRSIELVDRFGHQATVYRESANREFPKFELLYLRKGLLDEYLHSINRKLIWVVWGERDFHYEVLQRISRKPDVVAVFQSHKQIHKHLIRY